MEKIPMEKMQELFDKSINEVFDDKCQNCDKATIMQIQELLLIKGIKAFYFTASLQFINHYLNEITKK